MKKESKFWQLVKKKTPQIQWTRLESWASFGVPDLLGYNDNCGFFLVELKVVEGNKVRFSPHQKLFHLTRKKRNFILINQPSLKLVKYESARSPVCLQTTALFPSQSTIGIMSSVACSSLVGRLSACSLARSITFSFSSFNVINFSLSTFSFSSLIRFGFQ